jgi:hypothetical protein
MAKIMAKMDDGQFFLDTHADCSCRLLFGAIPPEHVKGGIASQNGVREIQVEID